MLSGHQKLNVWVSVAGMLLLMSSTSLYLAVDNPNRQLQWIVSLLAGVGGSVLATGITNSIMAMRLLPNALEPVLEALSPRTRVVRRNHTLALDFDFEGGFVHLTKVHKFELVNSGAQIQRTLSMYTDTVAWRHESRGGFTRVIQPNEEDLEGESLKRRLESKNGKMVFRKQFRLPHKVPSPFAFYSHEYYRKADRLIWTVEDLAEDFQITIHNRTGVTGFIVKINHHRENEIKVRHHIHNSNHEEISFSFGCPILPYQGFELMWDLDPSDDDRSDEQAGAGQPATRPELKSEGGIKPEPESEGRSR
jgi:hypothetical protein